MNLGILEVLDNLTFIDGNIFKSNMQSLVNPVNCDGIMGSGLANEFKKRYPRMYDDYRKKCRCGLLVLGKVEPWKELGGKIIFNFPTKKHWRNPSRLEWIDDGLRYFFEHYHDWNIDSVAFPALGCGNGKLKWNEVKDLLEKYLRGTDIQVEIYLPRKIT